MDKNTVLWDPKFVCNLFSKQCSILHMHTCTNAQTFFWVQVWFSTLLGTYVQCMQVFNHLLHDVSQCTQYNIFLSCFTPYCLYLTWHHYLCYFIMNTDKLYEYECISSNMRMCMELFFFLLKSSTVSKPLFWLFWLYTHTKMKIENPTPLYM